MEGNAAIYGIVHTRENEAGALVESEILSLKHVKTRNGNTLFAVRIKIKLINNGLLCLLPLS